MGYERDIKGTDSFGKEVLEKILRNPEAGMGAGWKEQMRVINSPQNT